MSARAWWRSEKHANCVEENCVLARADRKEFEDIGLNTKRRSFSFIDLCLEDESA